MNAARIFLLIALFIAWYALSALDMPPGVLLAASLAGPPLMLLVAYAGRRALDRRPTPEHAARVTAGVHDALMAVIGSEAIAAVRLFRAEPVARIPVPEVLGLGLVIASALLLLASTANLILSGLGVPVAVLPTRRLADDWLYSHTRNPIVLSALLLLISLGLWLQSAALAAWALALLAPAAVVVLRVFEERELEIRFGQEYLDYKARVPMLLPRLPHRPGRKMIPRG